MVAKSYQNLEVLTKPYELNGRQYVQVRTLKGATKQVRWYSEKEYMKLYPEAKKEMDKITSFTSMKDTLGFKNGYITIIKGDTIPWDDWFNKSEARYSRPWGWYFTSETDLPTLPTELSPITLKWEEVSTNDILNPEAQIKEYIESLIYDPSGEYVGEVGDRLDLILTVSRVHHVESNYGGSALHVFHDPAGNTFTWLTSARTLIEGKTYSLKGTIKEQKTYRGTKQNVLTRCTITKEI